MLLNKKLTALLFTLAVILIAIPLQGRNIKGRVLDNKNQPVAGAVVMYQGNGVLTNNDGSFEISIPSAGGTIEVSCLGYLSQKVNVSPERDNILIQIREDALQLEGTVVVGYGTTKKINLTGAISTVEAEDLANRTSNTLTHMMQGSVPGLTVTTGSGQPNDKPIMNIRGYTSINSENAGFAQPLVLVDGIEADINQVNPDDVETISVIKDASSSAIYGARAAFGVILIATKSGKSDAGKPRVHYSGNIGLSRPTTSTDYIRTGYDHVKIVDLFYNNMNGTNYTKYTEKDMEELLARRNDLVENPARPWVVQEVRDGKLSYIYYCNTDWYHEMFQDNSPTTQHNISVSGGDDSIQYYLSGGYKHREGTYKVRPEKYDRYNVRAKMNVNVNKWLSIGDNMAFYASNYDYPGNATPSYNWSYASVHGLSSFPLKNPDGTWVYSTVLSSVNLTNGCHIDLGQDTKVNWKKESNFSNTADLSIHPIEGLDIRADFTYRINNEYDRNRWTTMQYSKFPNETKDETTGRFANHLEEWRFRTEYMAVNAYATYQKTWADAHNFKSLAGYNYEQQSWGKLYTDGKDLSSQYLSAYALMPSSVGSVKDEQQEYALAGFFGRVNYDYKGKYLAEISGRADGSSRFPAEKRWGFFPSASAGWKFTDESFMEGARDVLNYGKLRLSWGWLGNQNIGNYYFARTMSVQDSGWLMEDEQANPKMAYAKEPRGAALTWEVAKHYNLGLDLGLLDNRLSFSGEAYIRRTVGMITGALVLPASYGTTAPQENCANLRTNGVELSIIWKDSFALAGRPFNYSVTATYNDYITVITKYSGNAEKNLRPLYEGKRVGDLWGYRTDGLFQTDQEAKEYTDAVNCNKVGENLPDGWKAGDLKFLDLNGDGIINNGSGTLDNHGDLDIIGNTEPRYIYSFTLAGNWNGFDMSAFFQGIGRMNWYPPGDNRNFWFCYARAGSTWIPKDFMDQVWSPENPDAYFPRPAAGDGKMLGYLTATNDRYLQNIGYLRLKNLTFGYSLPRKIVQKAGLGKVRVYFSGENLWYWSPIKKYDKYIDPENAMAEGSSWLFYYPWQKTFSLGIDIDF
jgi:TonB-linked SusC/RagA family outer membrane protein